MLSAHLAQLQIWQLNDILLSIAIHLHEKSPPVVANKQDEGLQPPPKSFEFTTQQPQLDYEYNPYLFYANREDFMSKLIGTDLQTPEYAYAYMQSMPISLFASFHLAIVGSSSTLVVNDLNPQSTNQRNFNPNYNEFVQEKKLVPNEKRQSHEHGRICQNSTKNRQAPKCGVGRHKWH